MGIAHLTPRFQRVALPKVALVHLCSSMCLVVVYVYLIIGVSVFLLPCSILSASVLSLVTQANYRCNDPRFNYSQIYGHCLTSAYLIFYSIFRFLNFCFNHFICSLTYSYSYLLTLLSCDIEKIPGPNNNGFLKLYHWNLNSISAREQIKIPLIEAYNSIHHHDVFVISETMLNNTVHNEDIVIDGFSRDIYRSDHVNNLRQGGVCIYYREGLSNKRRRDLESLNEMVCADVTVAREKILLSALYRSPSQTVEKFEGFISGLQTLIDKF